MGVPLAGGGEVLHQLLQLHSGVQQLHAGLGGVLAGVLGVEPAEDDVRAVEHVLVLAFGQPHEVTDDFQREAGGDQIDEVATGPGREETVDHKGGDGSDPVLQTGDRRGGERPRDDPPQPGVLRIVHVDHRAEVLDEVLGQVRNRGGAAEPGGEDLGVAARGDDVGVPDERVVPRAARRPGKLDLGEERRGVEPAQPLERRRPLGLRPRPELPAR